MGRLLSPILREVGENLVAYRCPGCGENHQLPLGRGPGPRWAYNGNPVSPTFRPSVLARGIRSDLSDAEMEQYEKEFPGSGTREAAFRSRFGFICHSWVTDGKVQFLSDSTHANAGKVLEIPPWPSYPD